MKVAALVQARMGSTRMPGKMLMEIAGRPMLLQVINRLKCSGSIDIVTVATTINKKDDAIEEFCRANKINFYRGSEDDITDRLYRAGLMAHADIIVRVWGDCPLVDPFLIDEGVEEFKKQKADYLSNFLPEKSYPHGLEFEIYSIHILEEITLNTKDNFFKEFPFEFVRENSHRFKTVSLKNAEDLYDLANFTVDYPQDREVMSKILQHFAQKKPVFGFTDVVKYCKENKKIISKNIGLKRNIEYNQKSQVRRGGNICNRLS